MPWTAVQALLTSVILLGAILPPGLLTLRVLKIELPPLARLAVAMGLGLVLVLFALLLELTIGGPWLIVPLTLGGWWLLGVDRLSLGRLQSLAPELITGIFLGSLALVANGGDVLRMNDALSVRFGFDVWDRAFYGTVAQELERAPIWRLENPTFAPAPLQYSYLPALAGVFIQRYAGVDPLVAFGTCLPAFGLFFAGIATAALAQSFGGGRLTRILCMALVPLGGDLSFLVPEVNSNWLERTRLFFVFHSFVGESMFYNPWMLGVPLGFVTLLCLKVLLDGTDSAAITPTALLLAGLFQTKVFAFIPIWLAVTLLAATGRHRRLAAVSAMSLLLASPGFFLVAASEGVRGGAPLAIEPLGMAREAVATNPSLFSLAQSAGTPAALAVVVLCGLGFRLLGVPGLFRRARANGGDAPRLFALVVVIGIALALTFVGRPTRLEGTQFNFLPYALLWVFTGLALGGMFERSGLSRLLAILIAGLSVVAPVRYLAFKAAPELLSAASSGDSVRFKLSATTLEACRWLRANSAPHDRVVLPLSGDPEGGLKPLYVGLLASRRLVGQAGLFHVSADLARERQAMILRLYETTDRTEGERLLSELRVSWVWEETQRRLQFQSPLLRSVAEFGPTRLTRVDGSSEKR